MTAPHSLVSLGVEGFSFADLFVPERLEGLHERFLAYFRDTDPKSFEAFAAYRASRGEGMGPVETSEVLLRAAPVVSSFVAKLFRVEAECAEHKARAAREAVIWEFRNAFIKPRVLRPKPSAEEAAMKVGAEPVMRALVDTFVPDGCAEDLELRVCTAGQRLHDIDSAARKASKGGGAVFDDEMRHDAQSLRRALTGVPGATHAVSVAEAAPSETEDASVVAFALEQLAVWLRASVASRGPEVANWESLREVQPIQYDQLVQLERPVHSFPELLVGPKNHRRQRPGFALTDGRGTPRRIDYEADYCLLCHDRDKDSCSKGLVDIKTRTVKKNPLGVALDGCPLHEKIGEMHALRRQGDNIGALSLICVDNPMCAGTGHRICNDCMKACIFQKQEPVNIPEIETRVLSDVLALPFGFEMYGLLTRWNPLNVRRPYPRPLTGKSVLVVGLGPAGYTLAHHLACEGFVVAGIDGLKLEPLCEELFGPARAPRPIRDISTIQVPLDQRVGLGFGGVSEYGITVRWDKNFLQVLYLSLVRNPNFRPFGGVRFGGTLTLQDAFDYGFDHVALAAGAGRPTLIDIKNNLARGIRKASDFLMALQLTGAFKRNSLANLQVRLPAVVIGGGLTAIDTATELLAYYIVQIEKEAERFHALERESDPVALRKLFDDEEWEILQEHLGHAAELTEERERAARENREPRISELLDSWGGVTLAYRKGLADSPAYRLNHEEVVKSLEEGVRYAEYLTPKEASLDARGHVQAMVFVRRDGSELRLPARTVCVAAGTSPNVIYEKEHAGTFKLDRRGQFFQAHRLVEGEGGRTLVPAEDNLDTAFFTSYWRDGRAVSFYGDNHPHYAGSVVKAMASAKNGYAHVVELLGNSPARDQAAAARTREALFEKLDDELSARVVETRRLTSTIVEVVLHAKAAARCFEPGQFFRLQNFETTAPTMGGTKLAMEGLALTGAWVDKEKGLLGTIVLEMGHSSRLCAALRPGERVVLMGPTGTPTEIGAKETVLLCGGGLGNAVLFSIARAFKQAGSHVLYFAGYKRGEDLFRQEDIEAFTDQVIWCTDSGAEITPRRPNDAHFRGNIVQAMVAYGDAALGVSTTAPLSQVGRIIAIGSDRMMNAVREARHGVLAPKLDKRHLAIGSINSPMQCMMKEVCAQCLQKHRDPETGQEYVVFSCFNQDQELDRVDFDHLAARLRSNSMQEKLTNLWLERLTRS